MLGYISRFPIRSPEFETISTISTNSQKAHVPVRGARAKGQSTNRSSPSGACLLRPGSLAVVTGINTTCCKIYIFNVYKRIKEEVNNSQIILMLRSASWGREKLRRVYPAHAFLLLFCSKSCPCPTLSIGSPTKDFYSIFYWVNVLPSTAREVSLWLWKLLCPPFDQSYIWSSWSW